MRDELELCSAKEKIELDVTQFWAIDSTFEQKVSQAALNFKSMINALDGNETSDLKTLDKLVNDLNLGNNSSVNSLSNEEKMYVLIGFYEGNPEHEELYSLEYFNEDYWNV